MTKVILMLAASLLAGAALAQSGAKVQASAATDAVKPPPASAASHASAATDAVKPAAASINASAATDAARTKASAATDAPRLIPQPRKTKQPAAEAGKPVK